MKIKKFPLFVVAFLLIVLVSACAKMHRSKNSQSKKEIKEQNE